MIRSGGLGARLSYKTQVLTKFAPLLMTRLGKTDTV
jgi:hypothetical protein